jgi:sialate O-acetylesterase
MRRRKPLAVLAIYTLLFAPAHLFADLNVPKIFSDNMVLQREKTIPVWGWEDAGTAVHVLLDGQVQKTTAGDDGKWMVTFAAKKAGGPHKLVIEGKNRLEFNDVLVGEVWLCSGQSNMEWPVSRSNNAKEEIGAAKHPTIRHIKFGHRPAEEPATDVPSPGWQVCSPETVAGFTAVGYFFGRELQSELDIPIGLIGCNWGGTRIEPWTPPVGFLETPGLKDIADNLANLPAKNNNGKINHQSPLALYNGMVHPMVPYGIRGAIWYQGESNNGEGMLYYEKMKALIHGWRKVWNNDSMPFYFVQLAPYTYGGDPTRLAGIWEAQMASLQIPHTGMAVTVDIANLKNIHPANKQDVGRRLALWALAKTYGNSGIVFSGPLYKSMKIEGNKIRVSFDHVGGGLVSRDGEPLNWFTIAGDDGAFVEASATVDGDDVLVHVNSVAKPVAVRFGWSQLAEPNLSNKEGLPASPFRTDGP